MKERYVETTLQKIKVENEFDGKVILDIGGGGEGIIGALYGNKVISIDIREDELLETNNDAIKCVMDGRELMFTNNNFDVVTLFYSLMYMNQDTQKEVLEEACRVLKIGGEIAIWDINVPSYSDDGKDIFVAQLEVELSIKKITTGYGVGLYERSHTKKNIMKILEKLGMSKVLESDNDLSYRLIYKKI